jgi:hypothetical protein
VSWRKWLVRGLVYTALGSLGLGIFLYQAYTNPRAVRQQVLDKLGRLFPGAQVSIDAASLRLFGGIALTDVHLSRRDDMERTDFLYVPAATIYHDKEQLLDGTVAVRKVVLTRARLRIVRDREGRWNLSGLMGPGGITEHVPTIVFEQGTVVLEDRSTPSSGPLLEIHDVAMTILNDPLDVLTIEGRGQSDVAGPVVISARAQRNAGELTASVELPSLPVGPTLVQHLSDWCPDAAVHLRQARGQGRIQADLTWLSGSPHPFTFDATCQVSHGEFSHARLPLPLEDIELSVRVVNTPISSADPPDVLLRVSVAKLEARSGASRVEASLKNLVVPRPAALPSSSPTLEDLVRELDWKVEHFDLKPSLFDSLPEAVHEFQREYQPAGPITVTYAFRRESAGNWHRSWVLTPEGMSAVCQCFSYPTEQITGTIEREEGTGLKDQVRVRLTGLAGGRPFAVRGTVTGTTAPAIDFHIEAADLPLDERLMKALPGPTQKLTRAFHPTGGLVGLDTTIWRPEGGTECRNRYHITVRQATVQYDLFPYLLENVSGIIDVLPDHWECRDFRGFHGEGEIRIEARSIPAAPPRTPGQLTGSSGASEPRALFAEEPRTQVIIQGLGLAIDQDIEDAITPPEGPARPTLQRTWKTMVPSGRLTFTANVIDRPDHPEDVDVTVDFSGCAIRPKFFEYTLASVQGSVRYLHERVYLKNIQARHGPGVLALPEGTIFLKPGGAFQARFLPPAIVRAVGIEPDDEFLAALPPGLRKGIEALHLRGPLEIGTGLVVDTAEANAPPVVWWDGWVQFRNAAMKAGVDITGLTGQIACAGQHNGQHLDQVLGGLWFDQATILGQPVERVHGQFEVARDSPDTLRLRNLHGDLYGGVLGGEARIGFGSGVHYDVILKAVQVDLARFGKQNGLGGELQGQAQAAVHLVGEGGDLADLRGGGQIDVPNGKLYKLPALLDLVKAFGLRKPDGTAFVEAHSTFAIVGPQLRFQDLDLVGNAISLRGSGAVNLDGSNLNLDFNADWGQAGKLFPPALVEIPRAIGDQLFKIKVRGKLGPGQIRYEKELLPAVTEPIKQLMGGQ